MCFYYYREYMDVAGSSGPEGGANYFDIWEFFHGFACLDIPGEALI